MPQTINRSDPRIPCTIDKVTTSNDRHRLMVGSRIDNW